MTRDGVCIAVCRDRIGMLLTFDVVARASGSELEHNEVVYCSATQSSFYSCDTIHFFLEVPPRAPSPARTHALSSRAAFQARL